MFEELAIMCSFVNTVDLEIISVRLEGWDVWI